MRLFLARCLRQSNWLLLAILALAILQLSPIARTGYMGDDAGNSLTPGILGYHGYSLAGYCYSQCRAWLFELARFYPLIFPQIYGTFCLLPNLLLYKSMMIGVVVVDLLLFARLVRRFTGCDGFPELATLAVVVLLQFSFGDDPLLGYSGLLPEICLSVLLSLIWLCRYLETGRPAWLVASSLAYLIALLTYEVVYPFFILHVLLIGSRERRWKLFLLRSLPFVGCALFCVGISLLLRWQIGTNSPRIHQLNLQWGPYVHTLVRQLGGALPLRNYLRNPHPELSLPLRRLALSSMIGFLGGVLLTLVTLCRLAKNGTSLWNYSGRCIVGLGLALWLLPALLVSSTSVYQAQIRWALPQLAVYIEYYGVALLLASVIAWIVMRLASRKGWLILSTGIAILLGGALAMTNQSNRQVTRHIARGWRDERLNLEAALRAGLVEEVPDDSTLILQHRYPWWHDFYVPFFYYQHAGKKLHFAWFPPGTPDLSSSRAIVIGHPIPGLPNGRVLVLLDGVRDEQAGFVLLGPWEEPTATSAGALGTATIPVRLFVRGPSKETICPQGAFALVGCDAVLRESATAELKFLRQGDDWALYLWPIEKDMLTALLRRP